MRLYDTASRAKRELPPPPGPIRMYFCGPTVYARALVRELKAVGGDLRALRQALTGRDRGPELWTVIAALPRDETLRRIDAAL